MSVESQFEAQGNPGTLWMAIAQSTVISRCTRIARGGGAPSDRCRVRVRWPSNPSSMPRFGFDDPSTIREQQVYPWVMVMTPVWLEFFTAAVSPFPVPWLMVRLP